MQFWCSQMWKRSTQCSKFRLLLGIITLPRIQVSTESHLTVGFGRIKRGLRFHQLTHNTAIEKHLRVCSWWDEQSCFPFLLLLLHFSYHRRTNSRWHVVYFGSWKFKISVCFLYHHSYHSFPFLWFEGCGTRVASLLQRFRFSQQLIT